MHLKIMSFSLGMIALCSLNADTSHTEVHSKNFQTNNVSAKSDHGDRLELGTMTILNREFYVTQLGELLPGEESAFEVDSNSGYAGLSAYLWVESKDGTRLSAPSKGIIEQGKLHFHVLTNADSTPYCIVLRVREGSKDERASLLLSGHGQEHHENRQKH